MKSLARQKLERQVLVKRELERRQVKKTPIGIVHPDGHLIRTIKNINGMYVPVDEEPGLYIAEKIEPVFTRPKRLTVLYGGRGSSKSISIGDLSAVQVHDEKRSVMCLREFQSSVADSVHGLVKGSIDRLSLDGFDVKDKGIYHANGAQCRFNGIARNPDAIKSLIGYPNFWVEEAGFLSSKSLQTLTPTARRGPVHGLPGTARKTDVSGVDLSKVRIIFTGNPGSSADPFSQRFIVPFEHHLETYGIYEDELHLIIKINYDDNPWYEDSELESERQFDEKNKSSAEYNWIWKGMFNDEVDNSIIKVDWFNAALDAHKLDHLKKAFEPRGIIRSAHDPSDEGGDDKAYACLHGSIFKNVIFNDKGDVEDGVRWSIGLAKGHGADYYIIDGDGMGAGCKGQISAELKGGTIKRHMYYGSAKGSGQDNASKIWEPSGMDGEPGQDEKRKTYADTFVNNRAQYGISLAQRFFNAYKCVVKGEYVDPDEMISIDVSGVVDQDGEPAIDQLRSEVCRVPLKPTNNGLKQLLDKKAMLKLGIPSPNGYDVMTMCLWVPPKKRNNETINYVKRPRV